MSGAGNLQKPLSRREVQTVGRPDPKGSALDLHTFEKV